MAVTAKEMLAQAIAVNGERQECYGDVEPVCEATAFLWRAYLLGSKRTIAPADVALMMALHKIARACCGPVVHVDHYVDIAGWAALAGEMEEGKPEFAREEEPEGPEDRS